MGVVVGAVQHGHSLAAPLTLMGVTFVALQALGPVHDALSANLGAVGVVVAARSSAALVRRVRQGSPTSSALIWPTSSPTARDFDMGLAGPNMTVSMPNIGGGFAMFAGGVAQALLLFGYRWWAPLLIGGAWGSTHHFLKSGAIWRARHSDDVVEQQRRAGYAYRLSVESPAAKEMRLFGLADWVVGGFASLRHQILDRSWEERRLSYRDTRWAIVIVVVANVVFFWSLARDANAGHLAAGLSSCSRKPHSARARSPSVSSTGGCERARNRFRLFSVWPSAWGRSEHCRRARSTRPRCPRTRSGSITCASTTRRVHTPCSTTSSWSYLPASHWPSSARTGRGRRRSRSCCAACTTRPRVRCWSTGWIARELDLMSWRSRVAAVFQDYVRYELTLRENVAPAGASDADVRAALEMARAGSLAGLDETLSRAYEGGTDLSGGQWQRVALARAMCGVRLGAGVIILDEPTAQLDVRGEVEIFERLLDATRGCTTVLISHRFSTVRHADHICVVESGRVVELGTHDELMAAGGRYRTMFELQAARFEDPDADHPRAGAARMMSLRAGMDDEELPSMWRSLVHSMRLAYRAEPKLLVISFVLVTASWLPDAFSALWLKLLIEGAIDGRNDLVAWAAVGLAAAAAAGWLLRTIGNRIEMRFRDRATIEVEAHVANLQASVGSIEHHERPAYLDRLQLLREQVFLLNHIYSSLMGSIGSIGRLLITLVLLGSISPVLVLLGLFAIPTVVVSTRRAAAERRAEEHAAPGMRLSRHLFDLGTAAGPGKEIRVDGIADVVADRRQVAWRTWYDEVAAARRVSALWQSLAWTVFGLAYVGAVVYVASGLDASAGDVVLALAAGANLSRYLGVTVGQAEFLRWTLDAAQRLVWLEQYAERHRDHADMPAPDRLREGIKLEHVSFRYPGDRPARARRRRSRTARGIGGRVRRGERRGQDDAREAAVPVLRTNGRHDHRRRNSTWHGSTRTSGASRLSGAFQDFFRFEYTAQHTVGVGDLEHLDEPDVVGAAVARGGAGDVVNAHAARPRHPTRTDMA